MESRINTTLLLKQRKKRAWSQNQLAEVSSLSLRTVQRIEKTGKASYESAQALASALDMHIEELMDQLSASQASIKPESKNSTFSTVAAFFSSLSILLASIFFLTNVQADQVKLDIEFSTDNSSTESFTLINPHQEASEFRIDDKYRVTVVPTTDKDGLFLLSLSFFQNSPDGYQLISQPKVLTKENEAATFVMEDQNNGALKLSINPSIAN